MPHSTESEQLLPCAMVFGFVFVLLKGKFAANKLGKLRQMENFSPSHPTASTPGGVWKVSLGIMRRKFILNEFAWIMTYLLGNGLNSRSRHNWAASPGAPTNELKNFRLNCEARFNHSCRCCCCQWQKPFSWHCQCLFKVPSVRTT